MIQLTSLLPQFESLDISINQLAQIQFSVSSQVPQIFSRLLCQAFLLQMPWSK